MITYEEQLNHDLRWAMEEGSLFFEGRGRVHETLRRVTARLDELGISYAVVGGMALFRHGYRRFTEDVDLLVTKESLKRIHEELEGLGYVRKFRHSKNLRDVRTQVSIEFLLTGEYPGDGKHKPVAFPDPTQAATEVDGVRYLNLRDLIELKLASGMSDPGRRKDLVDVGELIGLLNLPLSFRGDLSDYVGPTYDQLWNERRKRFVRPKRDVSDEDLERMLADGVTLDADEATLTTSDPDVARKYDLVEERELWTPDTG